MLSLVSFCIGACSDQGCAEIGAQDPSVIDARECGAPLTEPIDRTFLSGLRPRLAPNGSGYGVVWDGGDDGHIAAAFGRLDATGSLLPGWALMLPGSPEPTWQARVSFSGTHYGVVFFGGDPFGLPFATSRVSFMRVDGEGHVLASSRVVLPIGSPPAGLPPDEQYIQWTPAVAWSPARREWGVAWIEQAWPSAIHMELVFARLDATGALVAGSRIVIASASGPLDFDGNSDTPLVADGTGWALVWSDQTTRTLRLGRILSDGVLDPAGPVVVSTGSTEDASLAWDGAGYGVAWTVGHWRNGPEAQRVRFARVVAGAVAGSVVDLDTSGLGARTPSVAPDGPGDVDTHGAGFVVTYTRDVDPSGSNVNDVRMTRLDASGAIVSPASQQLVAPMGFVDGTSVVWDGCEHAVAFDVRDPWLGHIVRFR